MPLTENTLHALDQKIASLQAKRDALQLREGVLLLKKASKILAEKTTPHLILTILEEAWKGASDAQKKEWQNKAQSFPVRKKRQSRKASSPPLAAPHP